MVIQEVYIGKTDEVEAIFKEFCNLRHSYASWKTRKNSKQTAKIEEMIEDFFGFRAFSLEILPDKLPNAMTYPVSSSIDVNAADLIITTSKGYKFSRGARVAALSYITSGLFANDAFTDEEVFAAFLHELGHSFIHRSPMIEAQQDIYITTVIIQLIFEVILGIITMNPQMMLQSVTDVAMCTNFMKLFRTKLNKLVKRVPVLRELNVLTQGVTGILKGLLINTAHFILTITGVSSLVNHINKWEWKNLTGKQIAITGHTNAYSRSAERLSDDFATMYGYGPALSRALVKMENPDNQGLYMKVVHNIPVIKKLFNKADGMAMEMDGLIGVHPGSSDRILAILDGMERDLKTDKDLPDKVKKELAENIKLQRKVIVDIKSEEKNALTNKNDYLRAIELLGFKKGNSEDFMEKRFTDRDELKRFYDDRRLRHEQAAKDELDFALSMIDEGIM